MNIKRSRPTIKYVRNDKDESIQLEDDVVDFDKVIDTVKSLFRSGVKFINLDTKDYSIYFDNAPKLGERAITGKFKDLVKVKQ